MTFFLLLKLKIYDILEYLRKKMHTSMQKLWDWGSYVQFIYRKKAFFWFAFGGWDLVIPTISPETAVGREWCDTVTMSGVHPHAAINHMVFFLCHGMVLLYLWYYQHLTTLCWFVHEDIHVPTGSRLYQWVWIWRTHRPYSYRDKTWFLNQSFISQLERSSHKNT